MPSARPPNVASVQDMPPPGGYPKINYQRGARPRGVPTSLIWGSILGMTFYGFWQIGQTNKERRLALKERRDARMAIMPFLQAEQDKMLSEQIAASVAREKEIMKNVEGWKAGESVYSKRWVKPTFGL